MRLSPTHAPLPRIKLSTYMEDSQHFGQPSPPGDATIRRLAAPISRGWAHRHRRIECLVWHRHFGHAATAGAPETSHDQAHTIFSARRPDLSCRVHLCNLVRVVYSTQYWYIHRYIHTIQNSLTGDTTYMDDGWWVVALANSQFRVRAQPPQPCRRVGTERSPLVLQSSQKKISSASRPSHQWVFY